MDDRPIGNIPFTDGIVRTVLLDQDGRQYVIDDDGNWVYGCWIYVDEPFLINRPDMAES